MTNRKDFVVMLIAFCLAGVLFSAFPTRSNPLAGEYDPWADINEDGKINMYDIGYTAQRYGALGDPTKNVSVTNWPKTESVLVWYQYSLGDGASAISPMYHNDGYSTLHMLVNIAGLAGGETVDFVVSAPLYNATHDAFYPIPDYARTFTSTVYQSSVSIDVPWEEFYFHFHAASGTVCTVSLRYYLTWA